MLGAARDQRWFLLPWLLLASIFAHAVLPVGLPLFRNHGSAFSASTVDVSLAPSRKDRLSAAKRDEDAAKKSDFVSGGPFKWSLAKLSSIAETALSPAAPPGPPFQAGIAALLAQGEARPFQARAPPAA